VETTEEQQQQQVDVQCTLRINHIGQPCLRGDERSNSSTNTQQHSFTYTRTHVAGESIIQKPEPRERHATPLLTSLLCGSLKGVVPPYCSSPGSSFCHANGQFLQTQHHFNDI
jgi:hypothetical protein